MANDINPLQLAVDQQMQMMMAPELVAPEPAQTILIYGMGVISAILIIFTIRLCLRYKSTVPMMLFVGGTLAAYSIEALSDMLSHFTHNNDPSVTPLYIAYARVIPIHVLFIYTVYFGALYAFLYPKMRDRALTGSFLWKMFLGATVFAYTFEVIPIQLGFWKYFDPQPLYFWKGTLPPHFAMLNAFCMTFGVVAVDKVLPLLEDGIKKWGLVAVAPIAPLMGHIGAGTPYYWTMNAGVSEWWIHVGGIGSIGACCFGVWLLVQLGYTRRQPAGA
jgi:hypothetical protein